MELIFEILFDSVLDALKMLPFLFAAFLLIETTEQYSAVFIDHLFNKISKAGPLIGALLGCIPQCGFSVMTANLFSKGIVSFGTLLAVFLATSDEAVLILLGHPDQRGVIIRLLIVKVLIAITAGYIVDFCFSRRLTGEEDSHDLGGRCGGHDHQGVFMAALDHTLRLLGYLVLFSAGLDLLIEAAGISALSDFLLKGSIFQPFLTALFGFIPSCAASVLLAELYLSGAISFTSVISGLCTNAGLGLVVLFKVNKNKKENFSVIGLLYLTAITAGIILYKIF